LIGHAAEPSPELHALCSLECPGRPWAAAYRNADIAFFTDRTVQTRLDALGFELISHATAMP
jgi:hypothetical protein